MNDIWLIAHFIGLALAVGTGFAMFTLGMATTDMAPADRGAFMRRALALNRNGSTGLLLLIASGLGLLFGQGVEAMMVGGGAMFHVKLTLVVVLAGVFGYMQVLVLKAKSADGGTAMARVPVIGRVMLLLGLAIVVFAVLAFH